MSYSLTVDLHYGAGATGLTLAATFRNADGSTNGGGSATFTERGGGDYEGALVCPDTFQGWVRFSSNGGATARGTLALNPAETENADVKTSTRNSVAPLDSTATTTAVQTGLTAQGYTATRGPKLDNLDTTVGSRNSVAPDNTSIATILTRTDVATSTRSSHSAADVWAVGTRTLSSFGTLVADTAAAVWGAATRTLSAFGFGVTVADKTGYSLTAGEHTAIAADTQTGLTAQGYTPVRAALLDNLNATISSRLATAGYTAPPALSAIISGVLDELLSAHTDAGSVAEGIAAAGNAGDPWAAALPGAYTEGQAGYTVGHNLDVPNSTRAGAGASITTTGPVLTGGLVQLVPGDTYQTERGTALQWTYSGPVDLLTAPAPAVTLTISTLTPLVAAVTVGGTAGALTLTAELSAAETAPLLSGSEYRYAVAATWADPDTDRVTVVSGPVRVRA